MNDILEETVSPDDLKVTEHFIVVYHHVRFQQLSFVVEIREDLPRTSI